MNNIFKISDIGFMDLFSYCKEKLIGKKVRLDRNHGQVFPEGDFAGAEVTFLEPCMMNPNLRTSDPFREFKKGQTVTFLQIRLDKV